MPGVFLVVGFFCWAGLEFFWGVGGHCCLFALLLFVVFQRKIHTKCKILFPGGLPRHTLKQSLLTSQFIVLLLEGSTLGILLTLAPFSSHAEQ